MLRVLGLFFLGKLHYQSTARIVARAIRGERDRLGSFRHVPGEGVKRKISRLSARHGPGTELLVAYADARLCPVSGNGHSRQVRHAPIEIVLIGIGGNRWWLSHDR